MAKYTAKYITTFSGKIQQKLVRMSTMRAKFGKNTGKIILFFLKLPDLR